MLIVKVPGINGLGKTAGCRNAGNEVIAALDNIHSSEKGKPINKQLLDLEEIHLNNNNLQEADKLIYENCREMFNSQEKIIFLGGDHSISYSTCRAFLEHCKENKDNEAREQQTEPCLIVFDAHADCMPPMKEPTHEEWLRALIEKGFPVENILLVGARNLHQQEIQFLQKNKIKQVSTEQIEKDIEGTTDIIMEFSQGKSLYVSIDIDILEPAFAPAVAYAEPGGLSLRQLIYILQRLSMLKNLKALDIVEVDIEKDKKHDLRTIKLATKLLVEML